MKALVYQGPGKNALEERPTPNITVPTDAIVKVSKTVGADAELTHAADFNGPISRPLKFLLHAALGPWTRIIENRRPGS